MQIENNVINVSFAFRGGLISIALVSGHPTHKYIIFDVIKIRNPFFDMIHDLAYIAFFGFPFIWISTS